VQDEENQPLTQPAVEEGIGPGAHIQPATKTSGPPFLRDRRIRAIGGFLLFIVLIRIVFIPLAFMLLRPFRRQIRATLGDIGELVLLICVLLATFVMAKLERRSFFDYGLRGTRGLAKFLSGAVVGFVSLTVMLSALWCARDFQFGPVHMHGSALAGAAAGSLLGFVVVALFEETAFRGYALFALARGIRFWPAAVLLSVLFAYAHTGNSGESRVGIASVFAFGIVLAYSVWRTGSLLWAIGFHFMWDYSETFLYGVPDSGFVSPKHLLSASFTGPAWITGGSVGPEGSYFIFLVLAAVAAVIHIFYPRREFPVSDQRD